VGIYSQGMRFSSAAFVRGAAKHNDSGVIALLSNWAFDAPGLKG